MYDTTRDTNLEAFIRHEWQDGVPLDAAIAHVAHSARSDAPTLAVDSPDWEAAWREHFSYYDSAIARVIRLYAIAGGVRG